MDHALTRRTSLATGVAACFVLAACSPGRKDVATTDTTSTTPTSAATATDTATSAGTVSNNENKGMSDANILALLTATNRGEIAAAKVAEHKARNPQVKSFARQMVTDHTKMLTEGQALAKKLNITPVYPEGNDLMKDNADELKDLNGKKMGKDWDEDYVEKQIDDHKKAIDLINDSMKATQNAQLKTMLQQALPKVQSHLDAAQALKDKVKA